MIEPKNVTTSIDAMNLALDRALGDSNAIDQKGVLVPTFTATLTTVFAAPAASGATGLQIALIAGSVAGTVVSAYYGYRTLRPTGTNIGPNANNLEAGLGLDPATFDQNVLGSLIEAVNDQTEKNIRKSRNLVLAQFAATVTTLLVIATRLAGGF